MKIIKHGDTIYRFNCDCGCIFEMTTYELMKEQRSIIFVACHKCPDCGQIVHGRKKGYEEDRNESR